MLKSKKKALAMSVLCAVASVGFVAGVSAEETMKHELAPVIVEADADVLPGGYVSAKGTTGLLGEKNVMDVPFQQTNLTEKTIQQFAATPSEQSTNVLVNVPSIRTCGSTLYNDFSIRGQNANAYQMRINGIPGLFSQTNIPMNFIGSVDVISGPGTGINGVSAKESAGGTINMLTKRAGDEDHTRYTVGYSGHSVWNNEVDVSRRFGNNKENGLRIVASHMQGETAIDNEKVKQSNLGINFDRETENYKTNLFLGYRDTKVEQAHRYFDFTNGNITRLPSAPKLSKNYIFDGEQLGVKTYFATLNQEFKLGDTTKAFVNAGTAYNKAYSYIVAQSSRVDILDNNGNFSRNMVNEPFAIKNSYVQLGIEQDWKIGAVDNNLVLAYDKDWYMAQWGKSDEKNQGVVTGNLYSGNVSYNKFTPNLKKWQYSGKSQYYGWSAINTSKIGKADVILGIHKHTSSVVNASGNRTKTDGIAPTYGLVYKPTDKVSLFGSHSESFQEGGVIGSMYQNVNEILDPAKTKNNEFGVKYSNGDFLTSLSYFQMTQENRSEKRVPGFSKPFQTLDGEAKFKGAEWTFSGKIAPKWNLSGGLLYLNNEYQGNSNTYKNGKKISGTPEWSAVATLQYNPQDDLSIWTRMVYTGGASIYTTANRELEFASSTIFDLGASYKTKINNTPVTLNATMFNVFNKNYWMPRAGFDYGILGNPRTFAVSATFDI